jgi:ankyrin repeat protein
VVQLLLDTFLNLGTEEVMPGQDGTYDIFSEAVLTAAAKGHTQVLQRLLDVDVPLQHLPEAFRLASERRDAVAARLLLSKMSPFQVEEGVQGQQQHSPQGHSNHPLVIAAAHGHTEIMQLVLDSDSCPNSSVLAAALSAAAARGKVLAMQMLLEAGADVNGGQDRFHHNNPLHNAINGKQWAAAEVLLQKGAHTGFPALMHAVNSWALPCGYQLLQRYGACDEDNQALFAAAFGNQQQAAEILMAAEPTPTSIEAVAGRYETALCGAASGHHLSLVQSLLVSATSKLGEPAEGPPLLKQILNKPLQAAIAGHQYAREQQCGRDDGQEGRMSQHILRLARNRWTREDINIIKLLLQKGADPDYQEGRALVLAVQHRRGDMSQALLDAGAVKLDPALTAAAGAGYVELVEQLLKHSMDPVDSDGTAVLAAARGEHMDVLPLLLQRGANARAALQVAQDCGDTKAADLLTELLQGSKPDT